MRGPRRQESTLTSEARNNNKKNPARHSPVLFARPATGVWRNAAGNLAPHHCVDRGLAEGLAADEQAAPQGRVGLYAKDAPFFAIIPRKKGSVRPAGQRPAPSASVLAQRAGHWLAECRWGPAFFTPAGLAYSCIRATVGNAARKLPRGQSECRQLEVLHPNLKIQKEVVFFQNSGFSPVWPYHVHDTACTRDQNFAA